MTPKETLIESFEKGWRNIHETDPVSEVRKEFVKRFVLNHRESELKDLIKTIEGMKSITKHVDADEIAFHNSYSLAADDITSKIKELL